jgi:hypothetical protein
VGRWRRALAWAPWLLLGLAFADLAALKTGIISHAPAGLAAIFGATLVAFLARIAQVSWDLGRARRTLGGGIPELVLLAGFVAVVVGGMTNWLLGLQGAVILSEGETVRLHRGAELQVFEAGPLARLDEMKMVVTLDELELIPAGPDAFYPLSRLRVRRRDDEPLSLEVTPRAWARAGTLRFHQGAFGFAPRIVVLEGERAVFDGVVPFTTERRGRDGISLEGEVPGPAEGLQIRGAVDLATLDDGMRGHATLVLAVTRGDRLLGRGSLVPGRFADIEDGYRIGFAGLEKWSEIDISRRNYREVVLAGAAVALAGTLLWPLARKRKR